MEFVPCNFIGGLLGSTRPTSIFPLYFGKGIHRNFWGISQFADLSGHKR